MALSIILSVFVVLLAIASVGGGVFLALYGRAIKSAFAQTLGEYLTLAGSLGLFAIVMVQAIKEFPLLF